MTGEELDHWLIDPKRQPLVMGVLNVTPDSFSDGGQFASFDAAVAQAHRMVEAGADLIDIGGESTRPGAAAVSADEQIARVTPVLKHLRNQLPVLFSIDTQLASVAEACLDAGAHLVNDISAGRRDPELLPLVAKRDVPVILMHMLGEPATMQEAPRYHDVTREVAAFLQERALVATHMGVAWARVLLDPGIGFGKTTSHNLQLLHDIDKLVALNHPLVVGTSRKRFIGSIIGEPDPLKRQFGSAATIAWSIAHGASMVRVHDVGPMRQVVQMIRAIQRPPADSQGA